MLGLLLLEFCLLLLSKTELDKTKLSIIEWDIIETDQDQEESDIITTTDIDR